MLRKELTYFFSSPIAYIVVGVYVLSMALFLWIVPGEYNIADSGYAQMDGMFRLSPWLFMLLCPALTMHLISEERSSGTWDLVVSKPYPLWRIYVEKLTAAWIVVLLAVMLALVSVFFVYQMAEPKGNIDSGALIGSVIGLMLISLAFCSVGLWASTLSKRQVICFVLAATACFLLFYGFDLLSMLLGQGKAVRVVEQIGMNSHYESISRGVIDLGDVIYFLSVTVLFVVFSIGRKR